MPISTALKACFDDMVSRYKAGPTAYFYGRAKDPDHVKFCKLFDEKKRIIDASLDELDDFSVLYPLAYEITSGGQNNRFALECWVDFLNKYSSAPEIQNANGLDQSKALCTNILVGKYEQALVGIIQTADLTQQRHQQSTLNLQAKAEQLAADNVKLRETVDLMEQKLLHFEQLMMLNPVIEQAQGLLTVLVELTKGTPMKQALSLPPTRETIPSTTTDSIQLSAPIPAHSTASHATQVVPILKSKASPSSILAGINQSTVIESEKQSQSPKTSITPPPLPSVKEDKNNRLFSNKTLLSELSDAISKRQGAAAQKKNPDHLDLNHLLKVKLKSRRQSIHAPVIVADRSTYYEWD